MRALVIIVLVLACAGSAFAQPASRPERAKTDGVEYALPERAALQSTTFLAFGDSALVGVGHDVLFISHAGRAAQTIALPRGFDFVKTAIGGDGAVWFADGNGSAGRVDPTGRFFPIGLTSVALAIVADGARTDVLEANAIESFDAKGVVHRIPLGRTISRGSIAALPNEIVVAADGIAGIIRIDRDNRVEILKLEDDLRPASLHVVGNTVWFPLFTGGKIATRRIGRVHDRIIQTIDLPTFAPVTGMGAGADNRFYVIESFDVYGVVGLDGQLACERSIGTGFPGSLISQMFLDGEGSTYLTTSRVPGFLKVTDACR